MEKLARIMMINGWHKIHNMYRQYQNRDKGIVFIHPVCIYVEHNYLVYEKLAMLL